MGVLHEILILLDLLTKTLSSCISVSIVCILLPRAVLVERHQIRLTLVILMKSSDRSSQSCSSTTDLILWLSLSQHSFGTCWRSILEDVAWVIVAILILASIVESFLELRCLTAGYHLTAPLPVPSSRLQPILSTLIKHSFDRVLKPVESISQTIVSITITVISLQAKSSGLLLLLLFLLVLMEAPAISIT